MDLDIIIFMVSVVNVMAYVPQILTLIRNKHEAAIAVNLYSWHWWAWSNLFMAWFMLFDRDEVRAAIIFFVTFGGSITITTLTHYYKIKKI